MYLRILAVSILVGLSAHSANGQTLKEGTLYYDPPTGEMFIDAVWPGSDTFLGYALWSTDDLFITENYLRLGGSPDLFFVEDRGLSEGAAFAGGFENGLYQLGAVYPTNISEADLLADVRTQWGNELNYGFNVELGRPSGIPRNDPDLPKLQDAWAEAASLIYNAPTGELVLDTTGDQGGYVTGFNLVFLESIETNSAINPQPGNEFSVMSDSLAGIGLLPPGEYNLGAVLSPGLSLTELDDVIVQSKFSGAAAVGSSNIDISSAFGSAGDTQMSLVYVPEPAAKSTLFAAMLLIGLFARHRNA